jgi:hypothetical protein
VPIFSRQIECRLSTYSLCVDICLVLQQLPHLCLVPILSRLVQRRLSIIIRVSIHDVLQHQLHHCIVPILSRPV